MQELITEVDCWWSENSLSRTGAVIVAVSGGRDSMLLLHILQHLRDAGRIGCITAAWFDHGLRTNGEIQIEKDLVQSACRRLAVPLRCGSANYSTMQSLMQQNGMEAAARQLRYQFLLDCVRQQDVIADNPLLATAHHLDDQKETLLMRVGTGSGLAGLAGIAPVRQLLSGCVLVRPLLGIPAKKLAAAARQIELQYHTDSSNSNTDILRNRIRAQVVPSMDTAFASFDTSVARISQDVAELFDWLARVLPVQLEENVLSLQQGISINTRLFLQLPGGLRVQYLLQLYRFFLAPVDFSEHRKARKAFRIFEELNESCLSKANGTRLYADAVYEVFYDSGQLVVVSSSFLHNRWSVTIASCADRQQNVDQVKLPNGAVLQLQSIDIPYLLPCEARSFLPGDAGTNGKSLKKWFQKQRVLEYQRPGYAILEHPELGIFAVLDPAGDMHQL